MTSEKIRVLIVDDERNLREIYQAELDPAVFLVTTLDRGDGVLDILQQSEFDVVVLDLNLPGLGGMEVLARMKTAEIPAEVIILTGHATVDTAIDAIKLGAYDYLRKPVGLDELEIFIRKAAESRRLKRELVALRTQVDRQNRNHRIVAASPIMRTLLETVRKVAPTDYPVLITGESGVGKELIARALHRGSARADGPFIAINCGAVPEQMMESELFGFEKGAFTGAHARKLGLVELANEGTLFLDEIGEMPLNLQVKLLRVIETSRFFRLGGTREIAVSARLVSASNKNLKRESEQGAFRSDLFYRISGLSLEIPPLRERREDIPALVEYFQQRNPLFRNKRFGTEALAVLSRYGWPGNARELQNVVQRVLLLSPGNVVQPADLPADLGVGGTPASRRRLEDVEREHILRVLKETGEHREQTAGILGIHPRTLRRKLAEYGM